MDLTAGELVSAVGIKRIAAQAGVGVPAVYHHFGSVEGLAREVVESVYDPGEFDVDDVLRDMAVVREGTAPLQQGTALHAAEFDRVRGDAQLRLRIGLWALAGVSVDGAYRDLLRTVDARISASVDFLFGAWGRELRPPFDATTFVGIHSALLSGAVIRHLVDDEAVGREAFALTAQALSIMMLRIKGDHRTLQDRLVETNYYPLKQPRAGTAIRTTVRTRVLEVAAELFGRQGVAATRMMQIARLAGVGRSSLYNEFGSVDAIAVALLMEHAHDALVVDADRQNPWDLEELAVATVKFLTSRFDHVAPYAARLAVGDQVAGDPLTRLCREALVGAWGPDSAGIDVEWLSRSIVTLLISRVAHQPLADPRDTARSVLSLVQAYPTEHSA